MTHRKPSASTHSSSTYAGWLMAWIAFVVAGAGLLALLGTPLAPTSLVALFTGAPIALVWVAALEIELAQLVAGVFAIAALYGFLALRMIRQSGFALGCGLGCVLLDIVWGTFAVFGASGEASPTLVVLLAVVFFLPRIVLLYLIGQGLKTTGRSRISKLLGAFAANLVIFMLDPIAWIFYRFAGPNQSPEEQQSPSKRKAFDRRH